MGPSLTRPKVTPVIQHYLDLKAEFPETLLFYQMGDFYELFFDDARKAAELLDLTLTRRGEADGEPIPMAGIPVHAANNYFSRLLRRGGTAVIVDQAARDSVAAPVERFVSRMLTPGTIVDDELLEDRVDTLIVACCSEGATCGLASLDLSSGRFVAMDLRGEQELQAELERLRPAEILLPESGGDLAAGYNAATVSALPDQEFSASTSAEALRRQFTVASLDGFGRHDAPVGFRAAGALLGYAKSTQRRELTHITTLVAEHHDSALRMDAATRRNLDLDRQAGAPEDKSLVGLMDSCVGAMGSRLLRRWLLQPTRDKRLARLRHAAIEEVLLQLPMDEIRATLRVVGDIERALARVALRSSRPRDLVRLREALTTLPTLRELLAASNEDLLRPDHFAQDDTALLDFLRAAVASEPAAQITDGGVIADGFDSELDQLRETGADSTAALARFEAAERERTGLSNLKVGYNRVHGFYIELPRNQAELAPDDYQRRQTLKAVERYATDALREFEARTLSARDRALRRERELFARIIERVATELESLRALAAALATLDALTALAERAKTLNLTRPELHGGNEIEIREGRHPVVERRSEQPFVPNDLHLHDERRLLLVTGPNMGGKSTYMRQVAVVTLLAWAGSFVPASHARVGAVDRIFTRVGANDDLAAGQSTFMVEMTETANILRNATANSLVLVDEIGRGTSTYDGVAIAEAVVRHLAGLGCLCLVATHYFELTALAEALTGVANVHLRATEIGERIIFLHSVADGPANQSYGLQVAALAGLPADVLDLARGRLRDLEEHYGSSVQPPRTAAQPDMFRPPDPALAALRKLDPDAMTPREALAALYKLRELDSTEDLEKGPNRPV